MSHWAQLGQVDALGMGQVDAVVLLDKYIQRIYSFCLGMAFISSSEVEDIYISCENTKYALYYIHIFLYFTTVYPRQQGYVGPTLVVGGNVGVGIP